LNIRRKRQGAEKVTTKWARGLRYTYHIFNLFATQQWATAIASTARKARPASDTRWSGIRNTPSHVSAFGCKISISRRKNIISNTRRSISSSFGVENGGLGDMEIKIVYQQLTTQVRLHRAGYVLSCRVMSSNAREIPVENHKMFQDFFSKFSFLELCLTVAIHNAYEARIPWKSPPDICYGSREGALPFGQPVQHPPLGWTTSTAGVNDQISFADILSTYPRAAKEGTPPCARIIKHMRIWIRQVFSVALSSTKGGLHTYSS